MNRASSPNINEGTINFWMKSQFFENSFNEPQDIFFVNLEGGSIAMIKDIDNKLKIFYVVLGKGRMDLIFDLSNWTLKGEKHMFAVTWNLKIKEINLFIDGVKAASGKINLK